MLFSCSLPHWNLAGVGVSDLSLPLVTLLFYAHYTETINKLESGVGVFVFYPGVNQCISAEQARYYLHKLWPTPWMML